MANNTMTKLATTTVGSGGASSVTFSAIPQNYTDLIIKASVRMSNASTLGYNTIYFNGDTSVGNFYNYLYLDANLGGGPFSSSGSTLPWFTNTPAASSTSSTFSNYELTIPNYTSSNFKSGSMDSVGENNASGGAWLDFYAYLYKKTSPITSITITDIINSANFLQYSEFTLYGVYAGGTTTPSAPTIASATDLGGGTAQVTISSPAAIPYTVTSSPGGITATGMSPINISGLSPQTSYTFTAQAVAPFGVSAASSSSSSVSMYNGMTALATVAVGSGGSSTVTFSSIPSGYSHLQIRGISNATLSGGYLRFNGDSGTNYATHYLNGNGSTASAGAVTSSTYIYGILNGSATYAASIVDILDYTNTNKYKTTRTLSGADENGSGYVNFTSGVWMNTAAVTSITLSPQSGNFAQYSTFVLYGVK
jgi:hypothetical protein